MVERPMPMVPTNSQYKSCMVFAGLTVYDTQRIKSTYFQVSGTAMEEHVAVMGAVSLYLNFVNLFQFLLMFLGNRE